MTGRQGDTRTETLRRWAHGLAVIVILGAGAAWYIHSAREDARKSKAVSARIRAEHELQCKLMDEALGVVVPRGRADLGQTRDGIAPCDRPDTEQCGYKVEMEYELIEAGRGDLSDRVEAIDVGEECADELRFARKHGISAFRDHWALLKEAVERATATPEDMGDDRDPP
jgi:hypothetical protein